tara:strand:+ start:767 stop:2194 length:1428 start_codon:yes stop_codon:yes gene_type:complete
MANVFSNNQYNTATGVSIDDTRRQFNFGDRVAELAPQQSPFFVYLSKVAKKATNDPVFKFLEQRHQWQRRNFEIYSGSGDTLADGGAITANGSATLAAGEDLILTCKYDRFGKIGAGNAEGFQCDFIVPGSVIALKADDGNVYRFRVDPDTTMTVSADTFSQTSTNKEMHHETDEGKTTIVAEALICLQDIPQDTVVSAGAKGQVIGSAWAEGSTAPEGWEDKLFDREGYCQIFKTGMNLFSGTSMATEYRGVKNEWQRIWTDKLMEHKMDIEHAMLFGHGSTLPATQETSGTGAPARLTWGIVPYTNANGKVYNMSYASSGYDAFLDAMEDFFAPESGNSGNKLVLASRKVITYLNKLGNGSFMNNSVGSSQYRLDVSNVPGSFGHTVTVVNTIFGNLHFVADPLLRGPWEDYCVAVDMKNVAYRPLAGNGISRDTFIETNVQSPGTDGRQDQIITEAGLEISLPETHAILKFS